MRGRLAGTRRGPGAGGLLWRVTRSILGVALAALALMPIFGAVPHASIALTVPSVTVPRVSSEPAVTTPAVQVPTVPSVHLPPVTTPSIPVPPVSTRSVPEASLPSTSTSSPGESSASRGVAGTVSRLAAPSGASPGDGGPSTPATTYDSAPRGDSGAVAFSGTGSEAGEARDVGHAGKAALGRGHGAAPLTQQQLVKLVVRLNGCLSSVTPRQRQLLTLRTGFGLKRSYNTREVSRILGVSQRRESQIEQAAVGGLQQASQHSNCANATRSLSAVATAAIRAPFEIVDQMLGPGQSAPATALAGVSRAATPQRGSVHRQAPGSSSAGQSQTLNPAGSAGKSAVISPPDQGGMDWLLLAAALACLAAGSAAVIVRRRSQHPQLENGPGGRRARFPTWAAAPLATGGRTGSSAGVAPRSLTGSIPGA